MSSYFVKFKDGKIQCRICPHLCILSEGQRGRCFGHINREASLFSDNYGRAAVFCIDPVEKKPFYHFYPGSSVLSFGTMGCNLSCSFCQNWKLSQSRDIDIASINYVEPLSIAEAAVANSCKSVAYTYNEAVAFLEYAIDTADECKKKGILSTAVSAAYIRGRAREDFFSRMDAINVDLKAFSDDFYKNLCGASLAPVLDSLLYIRDKTDAWLELSCLIIPSCNDNPSDISAMCAWIIDNLGPDTPLHFSAFHPDFKMRNLRRTPLSTLVMARKTALDHGLKNVYIGNYPSDEGETTFCSNCSKPLIKRASYKIIEWNLKEDGLCSYCLRPCPGFFDEKSGDWGSKTKFLYL